MNYTPTITEELDKRIKALKKEALGLTPLKRKKRVEEIIEWYKGETGRDPDGYRLKWLADVLLIEEHSDRRKNKSKLMEYSFHSPRQERTRLERETLIDNDQDLNYMYQKCVKRIDSAFKKRTSEGSLND
jgi:hypothetical protein